ncbi:MAG TPA: hypothetical protein VJT83_04745, partial [Chitinophagaceae bacterium]|nr:hypothetical protein [Chitinophagaceae bacterium]
MRKLLLLLPAVFFIVSCEVKKESPKDTELLQQNLKGKVQTLEETTFPVDSTGVVGAQDSLVTTNEFTEVGYQTKSISKYNDGRV